MAVHTAGVAGHPVLAKTRGGLVDRAAEKHAWDRGALPEGRLRRKLVPSDGRDAELREILDGAGEARGGDDVVDLEDELGLGVGLAGVHVENGAGSLDPFDRRVE